MTRPSLAAELGRILTAHREAQLGVTRSALATKAGLAANTLREVEMGEANPTLTRVEELARTVYGLELSLVAASGPLTGTARPVT